MPLEIDPISAFISFCALLVSGMAVFFMMKFNDKKYNHNDFVMIETRFIDLEIMLKDIPGALEFHGVKLEELEGIGVTLDEFSYILANFTTGCMSHRASGRDYNEIELTSYRLRMLESEKTRKVWPFLKRMMSKSPCRDKIDEKIKEIESRNVDVS